MITALTSGAVLLALAGALTYAFTTASVRWWRSDVGRQNALTCAVYALAIGLATTSRVAHVHYPAWVALSSWVAIAAMTCGQAYLALKLRGAGRRRRRGMK